MSLGNQENLKLRLYTIRNTFGKTCYIFSSCFQLKTLGCRRLCFSEQLLHCTCLEEHFGSRNWKKDRKSCGHWAEIFRKFSYSFSAGMPKLHSTYLEHHFGFLLTKFHRNFIVFFSASNKNNSDCHRKFLGLDVKIAF